MSHTVIKNFVYFRGDKERIYLTEEQAEKLKKVLLEKDCPKFIKINGDAIATNIITSVEKTSDVYFD